MTSKAALWIVAGALNCSGCAVFLVGSGKWCVIGAAVWGFGYGIGKAMEREAANG